MKVIIIGAGIASLTLAIACERAGFEVKVYEKTATLKNIGGGILVWPHGLRYLQWLGLADALTPFSVPIHACNIYNRNGNTLFQEELSAFLDLIGGTILPIDRSILQSLLCKKLSPHCLALNKTCINVQDNELNAKVLFSDGTEDTADLVVGADGINSIIRKYLIPDAKPVYVDSCWWGGIVQSKYFPHYSKTESHFTLGLGKSCIVWPLYDEKFMWYVPVKMKATDLKNTQLKDICSDWCEDIQNLFSAPFTTKSFQLPICALPPQNKWSKNHVTLIGDAIHAFGPLLAQGASLGIEDAYLLAHLLEKRKDNIPAMLADYDLLRSPKYSQLYELENQSSTMMLTDDPQVLAAMEEQMKHLDLATMYKDLIPLVNETACLDLANKCDSAVIAG